MTNSPAIELRLLQSLRALVAECSITRAADTLNMSQPAMSHNLSKLRHLFGDPILTRGRKGLVPTTRALEADEIAREILGGVARLTAAPQIFDPKTSEATFTLTATEYTEYVLVSGLMAELRTEAPRVRVEVRPPDRSLIMDWLDRREVDLRLGWVYRPEPVLRSKRLFEEKLVVIARHGHPEISGSVSLEQYLRCAHVSSEVIGRRTTSRTIDDVLGSPKGRIVRQVQVQSALTIPHAVAESNLISTVPHGLAATWARTLGLQMLEPPVKLPLFRCAAYWHEAVDKDVRHRWFRGVLACAAKRVLSRCL